MNVAEIIWNICKENGLTDAGCAAVVGSADYESGLVPTALELSQQNRIGRNSDTYTSEVDVGFYHNFANDGAGYGLFQWTWHTRKEGLLNMAKERGTSIGDIETQMAFFFYEIGQGHGTLKNTLSVSENVSTTSRAMTTGYECPADMSEDAIQKRTGYAQKYYERYKGKKVEVKEMNLTAKQIKAALVYLGYEPGEVSNETDQNYSIAIKKFQTDSGITADGIVGNQTISKLKEAIANDKFIEVEGEKAEETSSDASFWSKYKNFTRNEFKCQCGGAYCNGFPYEMQEKLIKNAQAMRDHFGKPVHVTSGVRCKKRNAEVGGVETSRHQYGKAMDFYIDGVSGQKIIEWTTANNEISYSYIISGNYVHMDIL